MKKFLSVVIVFALVFGLLTACGGGGVDGDNPKLPNEYDGKFFTINCTYDFTVEETEAGATLQDSKSGLSIEILSLPMPASKLGDCDSLSEMTSDINSEVQNFTKEEIKLGKHKALWIEGDNNGLHGVMTIIPFDGWVVVGTVDEPGQTPEAVELSRQVIRSLRITDPGFMDKRYNKLDDEVNDKTLEYEKTETESEEKPVEEPDTDEDDNEVDAKPIDVGSGVIKLDAEHTGNYFTIKHPSSAEVMDFSIGGDNDMVMFSIDKLNVTIIASLENDSAGDISGTGADDIKVSGRNAKYIEMKLGSEGMVATCVLDMDGWWIVLMGSAEGASDDYLSTFKAMLNSFKITDENYLSN